MREPSGGARSVRRTIRLGLVLAVLAGPSLYSSMEKSVTLVVDGESVDVRTLAFSVGQMLGRRGIDVAPQDAVWPPLRSGLRDGMTVIVRRAPAVTLVADLRLRPPVVVREVVQVEEVPFATSTRYDPAMPVGTSRVERAGTPGHELVTYRVRIRDGREIDRTVAAAELFDLPKTEYVVVGTSSREREATWQQGDASWYRRDGLGAAHRWLPKGTRVTVTNLETGARITVIIDDRGPYGVPGRILDLSREAFARLAPLGQGVFPVHVEW